MQEDRGFLLKLTREAILEAEDVSIPVSVVLRKSLRIAYLREDWLNYIRLAIETVDLQNEQQRLLLQAQLRSHFPNDAKTLWESLLKEYIEERKAVFSDEREGQKEIVVTRNISALEIRVTEAREEIRRLVVPEGLHPADIYSLEQSRTKARIRLRELIVELRSILESIREKVHLFLVRTEQEILLGDMYTNVFEQNLRYVERKLGQIAPQALKQFVSSFYEYSSHHDPDSMAKALVSARRLLKTLADVVYPPREESVLGADGKERRLGEEQYIARLWQFVCEANNKASGKLLAVQVQDLGHRIDFLYKLINKGIHDEIDRFEFNQVLVQVFLVVGDILRLFDLVNKGEGPLTPRSADAATPRANVGGISA